MGKLHSLLHMQIPVKNLDESISWYIEYLGFTLKEHYGSSAFLALPTGPWLMLWQSSDDSHGHFRVDGKTMPTLLYATNDIHTLHDQLSQNHVSIVHYQDDGFGWVMKFYDPSGNMWGVIQEHVPLQQER